jgi:hypothetical protein
MLLLYEKFFYEKNLLPMKSSMRVTTFYNSRSIPPKQAMLSFALKTGEFVTHSESQNL